MSSGTEDEAEARAIEAVLIMGHKRSRRREQLIDALDKILGPQDDLIPTSALWDVYASHNHRDVSTTTQRKRKSACQRFSNWCRDNNVKSVQAIDRHIMRQFSEYLRSRGTTGKTYNNIRGELQAIFKVVEYCTDLPENPVKWMQTMSTRDSRSGRAFTSDEVESILEVCKSGVYQGDWYRACMVALYTGLRLTDIIDLVVSDIEENDIVLNPSKTKRHDIKVTIPIHAKLITILREIDHRPEEYMFPFIRNQTKSRNPLFSDILRSANVDPKGALLSFHCWRHTFRTRLAEARVSKEVAQKLGGWTTDISELYNHDYTSLREAIDALE